MICKNCNAEIDDNSKFCTECGTAVVLNDKAEYIEERIKTIDDALKGKNEENQNIDRQMSFNEFFFSAKGRISRIEFFARGFLPITIFLFLTLTMQRVLNAQILSGNLDISITSVNAVTIIISIWISYMTAVVSIKRFHDFNYNGWTYLWTFIPLINLIVIAMLMFKNKVDLDNRYGDFISHYTMSGLRWFFLVFNIILLFVLIVAFSISNVALASSERKYSEINSLVHNIKVKPSKLEDGDSDISNNNIQKSYAQTSYFNLTVNTVPSNAKVYITNIKPKYYDGIKLKKGSYYIKVVKDGYLTENFSIKLNNNIFRTIRLEKKKVKKAKKEIKTAFGYKLLDVFPSEKMKIKGGSNDELQCYQVPYDKIDILETFSVCLSKHPEYDNIIMSLEAMTSKNHSKTQCLSSLSSLKEQLENNYGSFTSIGNYHFKEINNRDVTVRCFESLEEKNRYHLQYMIRDLNLLRKTREYLKNKVSNTL